MKADGLVRKIVIATILLGMAAPAFAGGGHHPEPKNPGGEVEHWSVFNLLGESFIENVRTAWGQTWLKKDPAPDRTAHVFMSVVVFLLALLLTGLAMRRLRSGGDEAYLPEKRFGLFTAFEVVAEAVLNLMIDTMGRKQAKRFFPLIMTLCIFIFLGNALGMIPGFLPATDNLNTTLALGLVVFMVTHIYGIREHGLIKYLAHFCGPIRGWNPAVIVLMILMAIIEIFSHIFRPISLALRLMGNMVGDHKVLGIFLGFGLLVPLPVMALGLVVVVVQTLVFCLLSIIYISLAVEHAEGH